MRRGLSVGLLAVLLLGGCLNQADTTKMDDATNQFFAHARSKDFGPMYDAAAPELQSSMTRDTFIGMMQRVDRKMGACQPPVKSMNFRVNASTSGYFAEQGYTEACANGQLQVSLTTVLRDGQAKVAGFNFNSPLLLTD
jgi:hypothetical protein